MDFRRGVEHSDSRGIGGNRRTAFRKSCQRSDDEADRISRSMGVLSGERDQGRSPGGKDEPEWFEQRGRPRKGGKVFRGAKRDSKRGTGEGDGSKDQFSSA